MVERSSLLKCTDKLEAQTQVEKRKAEEKVERVQALRKRVRTALGTEAGEATVVS